MASETSWLSLAVTFGARPSIAPAVALRLNATRRIHDLPFELHAHRFSSGSHEMASTALLSVDAASARRLSFELVPWMEQILDEVASATFLDGERLVFDARADQQIFGAATVKCTPVSFDSWVTSNSSEFGNTAARIRAASVAGMRWLSSSRAVLKSGLPCVFSRLIATSENWGGISADDVLAGLDDLVKERMLDTKRDLARHGALRLTFAELQGEERHFAESLHAEILADAELAGWYREAPRDFMISLAGHLAFTDEESRYLLMLGTP